MYSLRAVTVMALRIQLIFPYNPYCLLGDTFGSGVSSSLNVVIIRTTVNNITYFEPNYKLPGVPSGNCCCCVRGHHLIFSHHRSVIFPVRPIPTGNKKIKFRIFLSFFSIFLLKIFLHFFLTNFKALSITLPSYYIYIASSSIALYLIV